MQRLSWMVFPLAAVLISAAQAQPILSGALGGTLESGSYFVVGDIWVEQGDALTIEAGTLLRFTGPFSFVINGGISINGTSGDPVVLTDTHDEWLGVTFTGTAATGSFFRHTVVEHSSEDGINILGAAPSFSRCTVQHNAGAGVSLSADAGPVEISGSQMRANHSRGMVVAGASSALLTDCAFRDNEANFGGGIACFGSSLELHNVVFENNSAAGFDQDGGGALYSSGATFLLISDCRFSGNTAYDEDDGGRGGALLLVNGEARIENCSFEGNRSEGWDVGADGGAIYANGITLQLSGCDFIGNSSIGYQHGGRGAALCLDFAGDGSTISGCNFFENTALGEYGHGGAVACATGATLNLERCVFTNNSTEVLGGAVFLDENQPVEMINCTFDGNQAGGGGSAVYCRNNSVVMANCIISHHTGDAVFVNPFSNLDAGYCDFYGPGQEHVAGFVPPGFGVISQQNNNGDACDEFFNIFLDPELVNAAENDVRLFPDSPCVDAGDPDSNPDPDNSVADLGAIPLATEAMRLHLNPVNTLLNPDGGTIVYDATLISNLSMAFPNLMYAALITLPNGTTLPQYVQQFSFGFAAYGNVTATDLSLAVPSLAPAGEYTFTGYAGLPPATVFASDQFNFTKPGARNTVSAPVRSEDFISGDAWPGTSGSAAAGSAVVPHEFSFGVVYPNPFNTEARVELELPAASATRVSLFTLTGREVRLLHNGPLAAGRHELRINGQGLASGLYFLCALSPESGIRVRKLTLLK